VTEDGYVCEAGSTDEECELNGYYCIEDTGCGNFVHGICEDCKTEGGGDDGKGLRVIVHVDIGISKDNLCVRTADDSRRAGCQSVRDGDVVTFQFGPGDVDIGEGVYACYQGYDDDCASAENGPEKEPVHIYH